MFCHRHHTLQCTFYTFGIVLFIYSIDCFIFIDHFDIIIMFLNDFPYIRKGAENFEKQI